MADIAAAAATQMRNIEVSTGRTVSQWTAAVADAGLVKHGQIMAWLKSEHGLTHGNANALAMAVREQVAGGRADDEALVAAQYAGAKSALRPVHDEVVRLARGLGRDVEVSVKKTGVSLRRARQFALVEAPSSKRVQLGLNLKGVAPTDRLKVMGGMCTHKVDLTGVVEIDDELTGWLRAAYDAAG